MTSIVGAFGDLDKRLRSLLVVAGFALLYVLLYNFIPGINDYLVENAPFGIVVVGIVRGTVVALLAIGVILIYRTNRFINFAQGALGSFVGVVAVGLHLEHGWPYFLVLPLGVLAGGLVGGITEMVVIRRFQNSSRLILTVASIGLAQLFGGLELLASKAIGFISLIGSFAPPIDWTIGVGVKTLGGDEVLIVLIVPFVIAGLAWFLLRTDAGVAVRAAAENADRALLLGIPIRRLSTIVWVIAGSLSALTFILKAPFAGVTPGVASNGPTVLLPALAAAVIARMESLPLAFAGGVALGILEQVVRWNTSGTPSIYDVIVLVVILGALLLQRGRLSRAQETGISTWSAIAVVKPIPAQLRRLPEVMWPKAGVLVLLGLAFVFVPKGWSSSNQLLAAFAITWAMAGVSLVILTGWGGHISLGQFGIVGVGGLVGGNMVADHNLDLFFMLLLAGLGGALAALVVGLPALRVKGPFLAVTTLGLAIALNSYFFNADIFPDLLPTSIPRPFLWERFDLTRNYNMYLVCLAFLALSILAAQGVRKARSGRVVIATRDNQRAADAAAVPTTGIKLSAFILAGVISGIAGGLSSIIQGGLGQGTYDASYSLDVFSWAVIGGLGSLGGALIGLLTFRYLETVTALGDLRLILTGAGLLIVLYALPGGLGQLVYSVRDRYLRWVANRRGLIVPSLVADRRDAGADKAADEVDLLRGALGREQAPVGAGAGAGAGR